MSPASERISSIDQALRRLEESLDRLHSEVRMSRTSIDALYAHMKDLKEEVGRLRTKIEEIRKEFNEKVDNLSKQVDKVENRLREAEENLENHLKKQDYVLEGHGEALVNELTLQTLLNIVSKHDEVTSFTLLYIGKNPLIVVENQESIMMLVIAEVPSMEVQEVLDELAERLRVFTDKKVEYKVLTARVPAKEVETGVEPAWSYVLE